MKSSVINLCEKIITFSFYALFALIPVVMTNTTSELFELNKIWLTWGLTVIILSSWVVKMILQREIFIQRTPLDVPIVLFLLSQIISTIFSIDSRVSWWGYYSRFNGGLLSFLSYAALYYAYASNISREQMYTTLKVILATAIFVALWGLPSHFGADPSCLLFRGTLDVSCWTEAFQPTIRIFSTLGQPAWLAAYLAALIPLAVAYSISHAEKGKHTSLISSLTDWKFILYVIITAIFYLDLVYSNTRGGFLAFWAANILFWGVLFIRRTFHIKKLIRYAFLFNAIFLIINFFSGTPIPQLDSFTLSGMQKLATRSSTTPTSPASALAQPAAGGTESGNIRLYVWKGAVDAWKANPIFGTGVETFAFAYYKHRPAGHNLTSEWDYLYNKAHNEYLNYLTTTGIAGLITYLSIIVLFLFYAAKSILRKNDDEETKTLMPTLFSLALVAGFVSILISNFFGFSVVMMNVFLFFFPLFYFFINKLIQSKKALHLSFSSTQYDKNYIDPYQWTGIILVFLISFYSLFLLLRFWQADKAYALGYNLSRAGDIQGAYLNLTEAVKLRSAEPVIKDEYAINLATVATALQQNNEASNAAQFAQQAVLLSNEIVTDHPNNVSFWKSRVRIFYLLSQTDPRYNTESLKAIEKAAELAPTDAKVLYNLGVIAGQNGDPKRGIEVLTKTIQLKPDYRDPYYARGLFYRQLAVDQNDRVINNDMQQKAINDMKYILENMSKDDEAAQTALKGWGVTL